MGGLSHQVPTSRCAGQTTGPATVGGVIFDVPDVLFDATLWRRWLLQLVGRLGVRISYADFEQAWNVQLVDVQCGRREYDEALETFLLLLGLTWAQVDEVEAASRIQRQKLEADSRPLPGAAGVLEGLARLGVPLAAWADVPLTGERLRERLAGLLPHIGFDVVLTSLDLEATQPDPHCYRSLLERLGVPPAEAIYVGHDAAHLAGAHACGLRTVAFNHGREAQADHFLARFDDLLSLAAKWLIRGTAPAASRRDDR